MVKRGKIGARKVSNRLLSTILSATLVVSSCVPALAAPIQEEENIVVEQSMEEVTEEAAVEEPASEPVMAEEELGAAREVRVAAEIQSGDVTIGTNNKMEYSGKAETPEVVVVVNGTTLSEGTHYTVKRPEVVNDADAYTYTITGIGSAYSGTVTKTFTVEKKAINNLNQISTDLTIPEQKYTGDQVEVDVPELSLTSHLRLKKDTDYIVSYGNNVNVGKATRTITFQGNYKGSITQNFTIKDENAEVIYDVSVEESQFAYTGSVFNVAAVKKAITVTDRNTLVKQEFDVVLDNTTKKNAGDKFKVTVSLNGEELLEKEYTIAKRDLSTIKDLKDVGSYTYNAAQQKPVILNLTSTSGVTLPTLSHAEISGYGANVNAGEGSYTLTAKADAVNYTGSATVKFDIQQMNLSGVYVEPIGNQTYEGGAEIKPLVKVFTTNSTTGKLIDSSQYELSYESNTDAGTAKVIITGKEDGNCKGTKNAAFTIAALDMADVTVNAADIPYNSINGSLNDAAIKAGKFIKLTYNGEALKEADYAFSTIQRDNLGSVNVTITGSTNLKNTKTIPVNITKAVLDATGTYTSAASFTYNGGAQKPNAKDLGTLSFTDKEGTADATKEIGYSEYEVLNWENNVEAGTATATIKGIDNFSGTATVDFTIQKLNLNNVTLAITGLKDIETAGGATTLLDNSTLEVKATKSGKTAILPADKYTATVASNVGEIAQVVVTAAGNDASIEGSATYSLPASTLEAPRPKVTPLALTADRVSVANIPVGLQVNDLNTKLKDYVTVVTKEGIKAAASLFTLSDIEVTGSHMEAGTKVTFKITGANATTVTGSVMQVTGTVGTPSITENCTVKFVSTPNVTYDGTAQTPEVVVTTNYLGSGNEKTLEKDKDYTVVYSSNVNATSKGKEAIATITGIDAYAGSDTATLKFDIKKEALSNVAEMVNFAAADTQYTGKVVDFTAKAELKLKNPASKVVLSKSDYKVESSVSPVTAKEVGDIVALTFTPAENSNFSGTATGSYTITARNLKDAQITLDKVSYGYTGEEIKPAVKVTMNISGETLTLKEGTDYVVSYKNNTTVPAEGAELPTVTVRAVAGGNFIDGASKTFTITPKAIDLSDYKVGAPSNSVYDGNSKAATLTEEGIVVPLTTDVKVVYKKDGKEIDAADVVNVGSYTATVVGVGNYTGNGHSTTFTIKPYRITKADAAKMAFTLKDASFAGVDTEAPVINTIKLSGATSTWMDTANFTITQYAKDFSESFTDYSAGEMKEATIQVNDELGNLVCDSSFSAKYTLVQGDICNVNLTKAFFFDTQKYTGQPLEPKVQASAELGAFPEWATVEYYLENINVSNKSAKASIKVVIPEGQKYEAETTTELLTFKIEKASQKLAISSSVEKALAKRNLGAKPYTLKVTGNKTALVFSSSAPGVVSVNSKGTLTYKKAGKAVITISTKGDGNYNAATKKITIAVYPKKPAKAVINYYKSLKKGQMAIKTKQMSGVTGYQITYSTDKKFDKSVKTVTVTTKSALSKTISKLSSGKTYYVKVRGFAKAGGNTTYGNYSTVKSVRVK